MKFVGIYIYTYIYDIYDIYASIFIFFKFGRAESIFVKSIMSNFLFTFFLLIIMFRNYYLLYSILLYIFFVL